MALVVLAEQRELLVILVSLVVQHTVVSAHKNLGGLELLLETYLAEMEEEAQAQDH